VAAVALPRRRRLPGSSAPALRSPQRRTAANYYDSYDYYGGGPVYYGGGPVDGYGGPYYGGGYGGYYRSGVPRYRGHPLASW
jgi:hypothetical protein